MSAQQSVVNKPVLRDIEGPEMLEIVLSDILRNAKESLDSEEFKERLRQQLRGSGRFDAHMVYPVSVCHMVVRVQAAARIKVFPGEKDPPARTVGADASVLDAAPEATLPAPGGAEPIEEVEASVTASAEAKREVGTSVETAPDRVREEHNLTVKQPAKQPNGRVVNAPVERRRQ
ncbi:MAG: hypothetical protein M3416_01385 [Acidobacteriota bacterium]|nr:hypothetical protein [Acidobacteriota bacterium]